MDEIIPAQNVVESRIYRIRDSSNAQYDLAKLYGVPVYRFNEAIKRNYKRFPIDLCSD